VSSGSGDADAAGARAGCRRRHTESASRSLTLKVTYIGSSGGHRGEQVALALPDERADPDLGPAHAAVERRADGGVAELEPAPLHAASSARTAARAILDARLAGGQRGLRVLERGAVGLHGGRQPRVMLVRI
jgi:hypothetical protein